MASSGGWGSRSYGSPEYAAAKAGLVRLTSALHGSPAADGVRVGCVVPHWIGLPRAQREYAAMTEQQRRASGGLIEPDVVVRAVLQLADGSADGAVLMIRPGRAPYPVDPGSADPLEPTDP